MNRRYDLRELKVEVNRECPLKCLHCSSNGMPHATDRLPLQRLIHLIEEFADLGGEKLCISGGEPLCYEGLQTVLGISRRYDIHTELYTVGIPSSNGLLRPASEELLDLLAREGVKVIFSLHGMQATTHDALTQVKGSFNTTLTAIERTLLAKIPTEVHIVPTAINFMEISSMTSLLASMRIRGISWLRFVPQGRGQQNRHILQLRKEQLALLIRTKVELQQEWRELKVRTGAPFNILLPDCPSACTAGLSVLVVRPNGRAVPCDAFKQFSLDDRFGNVLEHSLSEVWTHSELLNRVRRIQESTHDSECVSCPAFSRCRSGCLAQKAIAGRALTDGKDPDCLLKPAEGRVGEIEAVATS